MSAMVSFIDGVILRTPRPLSSWMGNRETVISWTMVLLTTAVSESSAYSLVAPADSALSDGHQEARTRTAASFVCGPNSLYMFLKMCGREVSYERVAALCGAGKRATAILELRDAASRLGLGTRIRRINDATLAHCRFPIIAHARHQIGERRVGQIGHYVLVVSVDETSVSLIDGTCAALIRYPRDHFMEFTSGVILERRSLLYDWNWGHILLSVVPTAVLASWLSTRAYDGRSSARGAL